MIPGSLDQFATRFAIALAIAVAALFVFGALQMRAVPQGSSSVAPESGVELPVVWGDMGKRLVESGAIDRAKWLELYGSLTEEENRLLDGSNPEKLRVTQENASHLLNLLWALGIANKNPILQDEMAMANLEYGGAGGFAATGGWILSEGDSMNHYGAHALVELTPAQQALVKKVSDGIYRPCCDNPTSFPDCNHGMAMLGLLELMASQGASEKKMWDAALAVNSYWFSDTYETIALYKKVKQGVLWKDVDPREVLGKDYSSYSGYTRIATEVASQQESGASCGI